MSFNTYEPCFPPCPPPCEPCCWPFPAECPHPHPTLAAFTSRTTAVCGRVQAYLIPSTPAPNADIVLDTKGTGALYRSNTSPDTNACRGPYSTDLQSNRTATRQVASGNSAVIAGGLGNIASGDYSIVGGGSGNISDTTYSTVAGGLNNFATTRLPAITTAPTVAGGENNIATGDHSSVGGGGNNHADGDYSTVAGGSGNIAGAIAFGSAFVGGGNLNMAIADSSTIAGGASNLADGTSAFVGGGTQNMAHGNSSTIAGGGGNVAGSTTATGFFSAIGGGGSNTTDGTASTIPGGFLNTTNGAYSSALGGYGLLLNNTYSSAVGTYNDDITPPAVPPPAGGYRLFMVGNGTATTRANVFSVDQKGNVRATGAIMTVPSGADFAESLESNSGEHYPYGTSVTLLPNGKIKKAEQGETPIGVVSNSAGFVCGGGDEYWQGKYERDEHGNIVLEDIPIGEDKPTLRKALKLSPNFDPSKAYIPRSQRPEWHTVGMLGFVEVLDGETIHPNWVRLHQKQAKPGKVWHLLR